MKREIKFRAWDEKLKIMTTPFIDFLVFEESENFRKGQVLHQHFEDEEFVPTEIMQYTGLKDKNGKEIFEGDILEGNLVVTFYDGAFGFWAKENSIPEFYMLYRYLGSRKVIGNIYENPELL